MWNQIYDPFNTIWISAIVAALPIVFFILALTIFKMKGHIAAMLSTLFAALVALLVYSMPIGRVVGSSVHGIFTGVYPVAAIVVGAIFLYKLSVKTGKFEIIKSSIVSLSVDKRIQVLLIAYCFGAFLEGAAGFGAPVAITAVILVGLGFEPVKAAGLCLVANIAGGSYGAMGIPVITPATLTELDPLLVAAKTAQIVPIVSFLVAFLLVFVVDGLKGIKETLPAILVCGGSFSLVQYFTLTTLGAALVDILSALISLAVLAIFLRYWKPVEKPKVKGVFMAWLPFILLTVIVIGFTYIKWNAAINLQIMGIHERVMKIPPVVNSPTPITAMFSVPLISTTTAIITAATLTILIYRIKVETIKESAKETFSELMLPILTICSVLAFAYICNYSGISSTLGLAFASTGSIFPLFSPLLGWIGVFLTGSVVNSGSLFAPLQTITATQIGIDPASMVASNVVGGDMAKMISPQSVAVAAAAVGIVGRENEVFKFTIKYSVILLVFVGILNLIIN
ncbi:L-lactate permease [Gracilibacillus marinus]|uniref:L-lactate permease n=1 Tax=Gracilibacillus marinus TaxID=630535 RepID=A0ABV8VYY6_9BACI